MRDATTITTIVTPAASTLLTDVPTFKNEIDITGSADDKYLNRQLGAASAALQAYCNRTFAAQTYSDEFFFARDSWPRVVRGEIAPLQLSSWPLISVTSVVETIAGVATTLVAGTDYLVSSVNLGQLTRLNTNGYPRHWHGSPVAVVYQAGFKTIPADVAEAALLLMKMRWYGRQRDPLVRSQNSPGVFEQTLVMGTGPGGADDMPAEVTAMVDRYRVPVVA